MNKKVIVLLTVCALLMAAVLIVKPGKKTDVEDNASESTTVSETEAVEEKTLAVIENIFDADGNVLPEFTTPQQETTPKETVPPVTVPTGPAGSDGPGLMNPDNSEPENVMPQKPTDPQPTEPAPTESKPTESAGSNQTEYEKFQALSPSEQQKVMESYESIEKFFEWYDGIKKDHEEVKPPIDVGDGNVNLDDIINGSNG